MRLLGVAVHAVQVMGCLVALNLPCSAIQADPRGSNDLPEPSVRAPSRGQLKSLDECFAAALHQSETVASQQEVIIQAEERIRQAYGSMLPNINGVASHFAQDTSSSVFPNSQDTIKLTLAQPLFVGLRDFATLHQNDALKGAAVQDQRAAEVQLYKDTAQAYYTVLSLEKDFDNVQAELKLDIKRSSELRERIRIGRSRVSEELSIQSAAANLNSQSDQLKGQMEAAREILAFQTGLPRDISLQDDAQMVPLRIPEVSHYLDHLEKRPDVLGSKSRVKASEEGVSLAKGGHLPSLFLTGDLYAVHPAPLTGSLWDVQLTLTLPIFAGGTAQSLVRTSASLLKQSELTLERARRFADQEIRTIYGTVLSDQAQMVSLAQAARLSERNYAEQSREYRLGLVTNIEVLQALTTSQESRRALDRVRYTLKNDIERLDAASTYKPAHLTQPEDQ